MNQKKEKSIVVFKSLLVIAVVYGLFQLFTYSISSNEAEHNEGNTYREKFDKEYNIFTISAPKQIDFANKAVPLDDPEVYERLDREIISNTYFHSNTILSFKRANRWFPIIEPILKENNIPNDFKYLALIESGLQNVTSPAGATGYWQFMEQTAIEYNLEVNEEVDERYNVEKSTQAACQYLNDAFKLYGDWSLVAASYNAGKNRISQELERQQSNNYYDLLLNSETKRYLFRILAVKQIMTHPKLYGFNVRKKDLYLPIQYRTIQVDSAVTDFVAFAKAHQLSYKTLKYFNPWLRQTFLRNRNSNTYSIKLPLDTNYNLN